MLLELHKYSQNALTQRYLNCKRTWYSFPVKKEDKGMLLAIMIGVAIAYLLFLTALYILFRADAWNRLFLRQLKLPGTGATEGTAFEGFERDDCSDADS